MTRNNELLERTMQWIKDHPEQHDQNTWVNDCGTAACFAGWACLLNATDRNAVVREHLAAQSARPWSGFDVLDRPGHVAQRATELLGLTIKQLVNGESIQQDVLNGRIS